MFPKRQHMRGGARGGRGGWSHHERTFQIPNLSPRCVSAAVGRPWVPQEHGPVPWVDPLAELEEGMLVAGGRPSGLLIKGRRNQSPEAPERQRRGV